MQVLEEIHGQTIGTVTLLMVFEPGPQGEMAFQIGGKPIQYPRLGPGVNGMIVPAIMQPRYSALYHPDTFELLGIFFDNGEEDLTVLFGKNWGDVIDWQGNEYTTPDPIKLIHSMGTSLLFREEEQTICVRFPMNIHAIDHFTREVRKSIRHIDQLSYMEIYHDIKTGAFKMAQMEVLEKDSRMLLDVEDFKHFPLEWKLEKHQEQKQEYYMQHIELPGEKQKPILKKPAKSKEEVVPPTTHLTHRQLLEKLEEIRSETVQWKIIEENLALKKQDRIYHLVVQYADLVAEHITRWSKEKVIETFSPQSATVIESIARYLSVDKVLALADENSQRDELLEWLRLREVERLLGHTFNGRIENKEEARLLLGISKDCSTEDMHKVWRRQLGFINADYGRGSEKAIHQKKDLIAKRLQEARNILKK